MHNRSPRRCQKWKFIPTKPKKSTKNYWWYLTFFNQNLNSFIKLFGKIPGYDLWIHFSIEIYGFINCWYVQNIIHPECVKLNLGGTSFDFNFKLHLDYCLLSNFFKSLIFFYIFEKNGIETSLTSGSDDDRLNLEHAFLGHSWTTIQKIIIVQNIIEKNIVETNRMWYRFDCTSQNHVISES